MAAMPQDAVDVEKPPVSVEEVQAELEVLLRSAAFDRSERLRKFLRYICELTLHGEGSRINEYLIGSEVFRKGESYNPSEDSIVRRQAHTLRQRLQEYYAGEGRDRPIRIELPVGRYVPVFRRQDQPSVLTLPSEPAQAPASPRAKFRHQLALVGAGLAIFGLGLAFGALWKSAWQKQAVTSPIGPAMKEIWGPWLSDPREPVICFSNPMTAWVRHFDKPHPADAIPLRLPIHPTEEGPFRRTFQLPPGGRIYLTPATNSSKMGEAISGVDLAGFFGGAGKSVTATQSRFVNWEVLRKQNLILLGHSESNQWVEPLLKKYPFHMSPTVGREPRSIVNTQPLEGEPSVYKIAYSDDESDANEEYALVSMLAGFEGDHQLLLIGGLNTQATQMATEFLTKEETLKELLSRLRALDGGHAGPWRFQAVLKTEVYDNVPTRAALVNVRLLK